MLDNDVEQILKNVVIITLMFLGVLCPIVLMCNNSDQIKFKNEKNELININEELKDNNNQLELRILSLEEEKTRLESILYTLNINNKIIGGNNAEVNK